MAVHATTTLYYNDQPIDIDTRMVPLIEALWSYGIETCSSCEDMGIYNGVAKGTAMIAFPDPDDARRFARTARRGMAVDPAVLRFGIVGDAEQAAAEGIPLSTIGVTFPNDRIAELVERLHTEHGRLTTGESPRAMQTTAAR
jgi:hypothetical protein